MNTENESPAVSVVIPCHNAETTIARTVVSVLNQTYPCHEIIIVDNNSDAEDKTAAIVESLNNGKLLYLNPTECANGNQARNIGSEAAEGQLIAYCDSDDIWDQNHLAARIEAYRRKKYRAIYGGARIDNGQFVRVLQSRQLKEGESPVEFLIGANKGFAQTSSFIVDKSLWKECPWDESLSRHQDYEFFIGIQKVSGWAFLDEATYTIRWYGTDVRRHNFESYWRFYSRYKDDLSNSGKANYLFTRWREALLFAPDDDHFPRFKSELARYKSLLGLPKRVFFAQPGLLKLLWPVIRNHV